MTLPQQSSPLFTTDQCAQQQRQIDDGNIAATLFDPIRDLNSSPVIGLMRLLLDRGGRTDDWTTIVIDFSDCLIDSLVTGDMIDCRSAFSVIFNRTRLVSRLEASDCDYWS